MRTMLALVVAALLVMLLMTAWVPAQAAPGRAVQWKFILDFLWQGPHAPFMVAHEKGYYGAEGLSISFDRGFGSADAVTKIASGAYDLGFGDINSMVEFNSKNPGRELVAIAVVYNAPPFAIVTLKRENITRPIELYGKTLGAPAGDAARRMWPLFARAIGMDPGSVTWMSMDIPLREPLLVRGEVNAIAGFYFGMFVVLKAMKVDPADIVPFVYGDYGLPLYGNAIIASPSLLKREPEAVRGFLRALVRAWKDTINNPGEGIAIMKRRDPLMNEHLELDRLLVATRTNVLTNDVKADGFGAIRPERLARSIDLLAEAFGLPSKPRWQDVFTNRFLPPKAERMLPSLR